MIFQRLRRWWWVRVCGLTDAGAADLEAGADAGEDVGYRIRRRGPRRLSLERLGELDRAALVGGPISDAVDAGLRRDLGCRTAPDAPGGDSRPPDGKYVVWGQGSRSERLVGPWSMGFWRRNAR